jgi:PhoPQ-activated pathogenicity-related protein
MCDQDVDAVVADLLKVLSEQGSLNHLDAYGGGLFAMELQDAFADLRKKGWEFDRPKKGE